MSKSTISKTQANLLTDLYNLMRDFPKNHEFNLKDWVEPSYTKIRTEKDAVDCGAACCAVAWAVIMLPSWGKRFHCCHDINVATGKYEISIKDKSECEIDGYYFGIVEDDFEYIIIDEHYPNNPTPKRVAKHIKDVLDDYGYELV